jgi:hypothetical protein
MMEAAREALVPFSARPLLIAVTVLTSMDGADLAEVGIAASPEEQVLRLALLAKDSGMDGVVCSPREARLLREHCGPGFVLVTPGVRPSTAAADDQARIATPAEAIAALKAAGVAEKSSTAAADDDDQDDDEDGFESDEDEDVEADLPEREDHSADPGLVPALLAYVRECPRDRPLWLSLAELTLETLADYDWRGCLEVAVSCGYVEPDNTEEVERSDLEEALHVWAVGLSEGGLAALVLAGAVYEWEEQNTETDLLQRIAARFGVDPVQPAGDAEVAA